MNDCYDKKKRVYLCLLMLLFLLLYLLVIWFSGLMIIRIAEVEREC